MRSLPLRTLAAMLGFFPLITLAAEPAPADGLTATPQEIRTPPAPATPRINGPRGYGACTGHPFFYHLPVTGERPFRFAATGLTLDPQTGRSMHLP